MTLRFLPAKCSHGIPVDHKYFGPSIDDETASLGWYFPECKDAAKNLRGHSPAELGAEDTSRYSEREIARGVGQRKPRSDAGVKRGPRTKAA